MAKSQIWSNLCEACSLFRLWLFVKWRLLLQPRQRLTINVGGQRLVLHSFDVDSQSGTIWESHTVFGFWRGRLPFQLFTLTHQPRDESIELLQMAIETERPHRSEIERAIFDEYRTQIIGNFDFNDETGGEVTEQVAPRVETLSEFLKLISKPKVLIADWDSQEHAFSIQFKCPWNPRGIEVRIVKDQIARVAV